MKRWLVSMPVAGTYSREVTAETEKDAIESALMEGLDGVEHIADLDELAVYRRFSSGWVSHVKHDEVKAEDLGEADDD